MPTCWAVVLSARRRCPIPREIEPYLVVSSHRGDLASGFTEAADDVLRIRDEEAAPIRAQRHSQRVVEVGIDRLPE